MDAETQMREPRATQQQPQDVPLAKLHHIKVLAVDDDSMNLEVLNHILIKQGFEVENAEDGEEAVEYLEAHPEEVDIILLDKMMPKMNGIDVLKRIKKHPVLKDIPVIMQTAAVAAENMIEGLDSGVYYYLTKPFDDSMLISIVNSAARDSLQRRKIRKEIQQNAEMMKMIRHCEFEFQTVSQAKTLASTLANFFPDPGRIVIGLTELMINAVEHGNLGLGYEKKVELISQGEDVWQEEIDRRLELPENKDKKAVVHLDQKEESIIITITDQGPGFKWQDYKDFDPLRMTEPSGRGIAKANIMAFDSLEYLGNGNQVTCMVHMNKTKETEEEEQDVF